MVPQTQPDRKADFLEPPAYFGQALEDAEALLKYAAELGIPVDDDTRDHILEARIASTAGWTEAAAANLLSALQDLAAKLKPVTAESLRACADKPKVTRYVSTSIALACIIVPFSVASFLTSAISTHLKENILDANDLSVKLRAQLGAPPSGPAPRENPPPIPASAGVSETTVITELQQYASDIRAIDGGARQLRVLVLGIEMDPFSSKRKDTKQLHDVFQLPEGLRDYAWAAGNRTEVYQDVRTFAQDLMEDVAVFYGAIGACILPVLYALLGTCAYLSRKFDQDISTRTYVPSITNSARFLIAAIGGGVVGLFNNFAIGQAASIPPLAIAFLVGYAVDVFFAFLEGTIQTFRGNSKSTTTAAS